MATQIQIACSGCSQTLAVDAASAGKQVRCPKCQALLVVPKPAASKPPASKPAPSPTKPVSDPNKKVVGCPNCQTKLAVQLAAQATIVKCPKCQTQLQIPAIKPTQPSPKPTAAAPQRRPTVSPQPLPTQPLPTQVAAKTPSASEPGLDLGQLAPLDEPFGNPQTARNLKPRKPPSKKVLEWINSHRWVTTVLSLNAIALLTCIFCPSLWILMAIYVPVGLAVVGFLFVPRQHVVQRIGEVVGQVWDHMGAQVATAGAGTILLILAGAAFKILRVTMKASDNPNLDFSGFADPTNIMGFMFSLLAFLTTVAIFFALWRWCGLARLTAIGYCATLLLVIVGGIAKANSDKFDVPGRMAARGMDTPRRPFPNSPKAVTKQSFEIARERAMQRKREFMNQDRQSTNTNPATKIDPVETNAVDAPLPKNPFEADDADAPNIANPFEMGDSQNDAPMNPTVSPDPLAQRPSSTTTQMRKVKRRPITIPIPSDSVQVTADTRLVAGIKLRSCYAGKWNLVTIKEVHADGAVLVNWDDWPAFTYDMTREDLIIAKKVLAGL